MGPACLHTGSYFLKPWKEKNQNYTIFVFQESETNLLYARFQWIVNPEIPLLTKSMIAFTGFTFGNFKMPFGLLLCSKFQMKSEEDGWPSCVLNTQREVGRSCLQLHILPFSFSVSFAASPEEDCTWNATLQSE